MGLLLDSGESSACIHNNHPSECNLCDRLTTVPSLSGIVASVAKTLTGRKYPTRSCCGRRHEIGECPYTKCCYCTALKKRGKLCPNRRNHKKK